MNEHRLIEDAPNERLGGHEFDQARASDPALSAWVSANAGSGKTHILVQRVVRLLLARTPPSKLLCLTFTKAAAANMSARVCERLARWTRLEDHALAAELAAFSGRPSTAGDLEHARQLFARTVETPGGLKIQTIHAFCERLLHLFPFEANVAARFEVIEDLRREELLAAARSSVLATAAENRDRALSEAVNHLADETSAAEFGEILAAAVRQRRLLADLDLETHAGRLRRHFALASGVDERSIVRAIVRDGIAPERWPVIAATFGEGIPMGRSFARVAAIEGVPEAKWTTYAKIFLTSGKPRQKLFAKDVRAAHPDLCAELDAEAPRLVGLLNQLLADATVRRTGALLRVGQAVTVRYASMKARAGLLDFDDLIAKTLTLLRRTGSDWVRYKLDAGIDHILVDEAQDTSPDQWEILKLLAGEFSAGEGARNMARTFFAVGDEKQSIFSFQGAVPRQFDEMRRHFQNSVAAGAEPGGRDAESFAHVRLNWSFRSAPAVLRCIDNVFAMPENFNGLSFDPAESRTVHQAWKHQLPGRVEVWDTVKATHVPDPVDWSLPVDVPGRRDPVSILAERIAACVQAWTAPGAAERVHDAERRPRRVVAGDVLVLVRTRSALFDAMIRALKRRGVAVAGADRMILNEHIAVMDLIAAARAALLRGDDLALACVLKSPLIGLDDDALMELAIGRGSKSLADALEGNRRYRAAAATLERWRREVAILSPFDFFMARVTDGARKQFAARLGPEAEDAVDEFLRRALDHEREAIPSMVRFLAAVDAANLEIKRDMEAAGDSVRVMTVHGAKGLEAKIVILADTCTIPTGRHDPKLFLLEPPDGDDGGGAPLLAWSARKADDPPAVERAREARKRDAMGEYRRLLYVAMTRAEERLVIAGHEGKPKADGSPSRPAECWYAMIERALAAELGESPAPWDASETIRVVAESGTPGLAHDDVRPPHQPVALPAWALRKAPIEPPTSPLRPASAYAGQVPPPPLDPKATPDLDARRVGRLTHTLLQHLPEVAPAARADAARRFAAAVGLTAAATQPIVDAVLQLLRAVNLAPLFGAGSRAEVAVAGTLRRGDGVGVTVTGRIDRMAVLEDEVWIADFKTGEARPPDPPTAYVEQLALYAALLAPLYPSRKLRAFLVWTQGSGMLELKPERLRRALADALARSRAT